VALRVWKRRAPTGGDLPVLGQTPLKVRAKSHPALDRGNSPEGCPPPFAGGRLTANNSPY
jgi:hypothetical protein